MEIKVRALDGVEAKGAQELEEELLKKHEQDLNGGDDADGDNGSGEGSGEGDNGDGDDAGAGDGGSGDGSDDNGGGADDDELTEEKVLSYLGKRYNKQISSFDELMAERNSSEELPEDVAAFLKYKKETGRGIQDFIELNKDYDAMEPDALLRNYLAATEKGLDAEDIDVLMQDFTFDEDIDPQSEISKKKIARKKALAEAKEYFNSQKEKYKAPLESRGTGVSQEENEELEQFRQYKQTATAQQEDARKKGEWFQKKSDEVFSKDFKGFEFDLDGTKLVFAPGSAADLKKAQSTPANFINKFLDENGLMKDAVGYHKALAIAMNPERFAKFFYEQGQSAAKDTTMKNIKNINMGERRAPEVVNKGGVQVKAVSSNSSQGLKIRSVKKS